MKFVSLTLMSLLLLSSLQAAAEDSSESKFKSATEKNLQSIEQMKAMTPQDGSGVQMTPEQVAELQKQVENLKVQQEEAGKALQDLDKE